nr:DNA-binding protein [Eubacteriales bacterium]
MEKYLLSLKDVKEMTGWGDTKAREILNRKGNKCTVRVGNRLYVNKDAFTKYLDDCAKYQIAI